MFVIPLVALLSFAPTVHVQQHAETVNVTIVQPAFSHRHGDSFVVKERGRTIARVNRAAFRLKLVKSARRLSFYWSHGGRLIPLRHVTFSVK